MCPTTSSEYFAHIFLPHQFPFVALWRVGALYHTSPFWCYLLLSRSPTCLLFAVSLCLGRKKAHTCFIFVVVTMSVLSLQVIPQLMARLDSKHNVAQLIKQVVIDLSKVHPQVPLFYYFMYRLWFYGVIDLVDLEVDWLAMSFQHYKL